MIRRPSPADAANIQQLLDAAFEPSVYESRVRTFAVNRVHHEWVFERDAKVVAHILFTQAFDGDRPIGWHLGPVAVHPEFQHQGIGSQLVRAAVNEEPIFPDSVFVLGDPHFYERFGFRVTEKARCPYNEGNTHFRALRWNDDGPIFEIGYCSSFSEAEE